MKLPFSLLIIVISFSPFSVNAGGPREIKELTKERVNKRITRVEKRLESSFDPEASILFINATCELTCLKRDLANHHMEPSDETRKSVKFSERLYKQKNSRGKKLWRNALNIRLKRGVKSS